MLDEKSWRNKNIDDSFSTLKKKKVIYESYIYVVVSTEEEDKNTLELKFISDADVANMIYDRF